MDIKVVNISKKYGSMETLRNINFDINTNDFITIIGKSGSGKTTLLSIVNSLLSPTEGRIYYNGRAFQSMSVFEKINLRKKYLSIILQKPYYLKNLSVKENILLPAFLQHEPFHAIKKQYSYYISLFGLNNKTHKKPSQLSGGEIQKMTIIRAVLENKDILIADEPTGDLDPEITQIIINLFTDLKQKGKTILMTTHNETFIQHLKSVYLLEKGRLKLL